jgi:DNA adenine methylase
MTAKPKNPAFRYYGGKFRLASWITQHFPSHVTYVEPFGGAAGVLLRKPLSPVEVYNDADSELFNFFQVLRDRRAEFLRALRYTPYSRQEHIQSFDVDVPCPVERARRFFIRGWQSFGGPSMSKTGWKRQKGLWQNNPRICQLGEWRAGIKNLAAVAERFRKVQIEHDDALKVIAHYDSPDTLFYCDPPYPGSVRARQRRQSYTVELEPSDHVHLANALKRIKGLSIVSTYPNDLYTDLFKGWPSVTTTCQTTNHDRIATEQLYISPRAYELLGLPSESQISDLKSEIPPEVAA